jgi:hypothetical protein
VVVSRRSGLGAWTEGRARLLLLAEGLARLLVVCVALLPLLVPT